MSGGQGLRLGRSMERLLVAIVLVLASIHVVFFAWVVIGRITYPADLEWMEGVVLLHAERLFEGTPIFVEATPDFVALPYSPLYYALVAMCFSFTGFSFVVGRSVSLVCTLLAVAILYWTVLRCSGSRLGGFVAACTYLSLFHEGFSWMDIARIDALLVLMIILPLLVLEERTNLLRLLSSSVLVGLAFMTKQSALPLLPIVACALVFRRNRREALLFTLMAVFVCASCVLVLHWISEGWSTPIVFSGPLRHPFSWAALASVICEFALERLPVLFVLAGFSLAVSFTQGKLRQRAYWFVATPAMVGSCIVMRTHEGSFDNVMLPAFWFLSLFVGFLLADLDDLVRPIPLFGRMRYVAKPLVLFLIALHFVTVLYNPCSEVPSDEDLVALAWLNDTIRAIDGDVLMPFSPTILRSAGKKTCYHATALWDAGRAGIVDEHDFIRSLLTSERYAAIVLPHEALVPETFHGISEFYFESRLLPLEPCYLIEPVGVGGATPGVIWVPRSRVSPRFDSQIDGGFEAARGFQGWSVDGTAFGSGSRREPYQARCRLLGFEGSGLACSYDADLGDEARGSITSLEFLVRYNRISFLVGGGWQPGQLSVRLMNGARVEHEVTGPGGDVLERVEWDVGKLHNTKCRIVVTDDSTRAWGHIAFDDLRHYATDFPLPVP